MDPSKYPAAVGYVVNVVMAAVVSFGFLSHTAAQGLAVAVVAATSLVVVFLVKPFALGAATGAFQTLLVAVAAFGFHLTDQQIAGAVGIFGLVAAVVTHVLAIPAVAVRKGTTVYQMDGLTR
jgi:hypothetical protein